MKYCKSCNTNKVESEFNKNRAKKDGLSTQCKSCRSIYNKTSIRKTEYNKAYSHHHKDELLMQSKDYYQKNRERIISRVKKRSKTLDGRKTRNRAGRAAIARDPITHKIRRQISKTKGKMFKGMWRFLPYSAEELIARLKQTLPEGYSFEAYLKGETDLHIDHIRPISSWPLEFRQTIESIPVIWALDNLQLLPAAKNMSKHAKWVEGE